MEQKTEKGKSGTETTESRGKSVEHLLDEVGDLYGSAAVALGYLKTLTGLGFQASESYTHTDIRKEIESSVGSIFLDWQGLFCLMEDQMTTADEALQKIDELISKGVAAERIGGRAQAAPEKPETAREKVQAKRREENQKVREYEIKEQIAAILDSARGMTTILDASGYGLRAGAAAKDINWVNVFDVLKEKREELTQEFNELDALTADFREQ